MPQHASRLKDACRNITQVVLGLAAVGSITAIGMFLRDMPQPLPQELVKSHIPSASCASKYYAPLLDGRVQCYLLRYHDATFASPCPTTPSPVGPRLKHAPGNSSHVRFELSAILQPSRSLGCAVSTEQTVSAIAVEDDRAFSGYVMAMCRIETPVGGRLVI